MIKYYENSMWNKKSENFKPVQNYTYKRINYVLKCLEKVKTYEKTGLEM